MAIGDDALAAGMQVLTGAEPANTIDTEINLTRDYIAQRTNAVQPVAKGGTGATDAAGARAALAVPETAVAGLKFTTPGFGRISFEAPGVAYVSELALASSLDAKADVSAVAGKARQNVEDGYLNPSVYGRTLGGSYRVCYVNADGTLGWVSSTRTVKENITPADIDPATVLAMQVVTYHRITAPEGVIEHGLIAEDLHDLGLTWLVDYGEGDTPEGVRYDLLALALIPTVQSLAARLDQLETVVNGNAAPAE